MFFFICFHQDVTIYSNSKQFFFLAALNGSLNISMSNYDSKMSCICCFMLNSFFIMKYSDEFGKHSIEVSLVKQTSCFNIWLWFSCSLSLSLFLYHLPAAGCEFRADARVCLGTHPSEAYHSVWCEILQELQRRDAGIHALSGWAVLKCATLVCRYFHFIWFAHFAMAVSLI